MTPLGWGLLAVAAIAAVVDWWAVAAETRRRAIVERVAKPATIVALIGVALVTPAQTPSVQTWLLLALGFGLAGDVLLLPPGQLVGGLVAFLAGHVAYVVAFLHLPLVDIGAGLGSVAAFAVIVFVGRPLVAAARGRGLHVPVALYLVAICIMANTATATMQPAVVLGAWLFVASDAMLGWGEFVETGESAERSGARTRGRLTLRLGVITTYHAAQALLTIGLLMAR